MPPMSHSVLPVTARLPLARALGRGRFLPLKSTPYVAGLYSISLSLPPSLYVVYACAVQQLSATAIGHKTSYCNAFKYSTPHPPSNTPNHVSQYMYTAATIVEILSGLYNWEYIREYVPELHQATSHTFACNFQGRQSKVKSPCSSQGPTLRMT